LAYTGAYGERGQAASASLAAPGIAQWSLTGPLAPGEGLTIVLSFPKGVVAEPERMQRIGWFLRDNAGVLVALAGLLLVAAWCLVRWHRVGRDPRGGVVIARYEPPEGHSPGGLRYMLKMGADMRAFSADILALAVDGGLRIEREDKVLKDAWALHRIPGRTPPRGGPLGALAAGLFPADKDAIALDKRNATALQKVRTAYFDALKKQYQPAMFQSNAGSVAIAALIGALAIGVAFGISGGAGLPWIIGCMLLMFAIVIAFAFLVRAPTPAGRKLLDEIEGLKLYLGVAEKDDLARMQGPGAEPRLDAERYERLLPYAVALDVEDAWTGKFTLAVGAAAAAASASAITWYHGGAITDMGSFANSIGSSLSSQIASSATPPGSSSGGGGGGFAGGGGGGGGGGGR